MLLKQQSAAGKRKAHEGVEGQQGKRDAGNSREPKRRAKEGSGGQRAKSVKDHAVQFLSDVMKEGIGGAK